MPEGSRPESVSNVGSTRTQAALPSICEVDVVIDPEVIEGTLVEGGVIQGTFWLSGRIL